MAHTKITVNEEKLGTNTAYAESKTKAPIAALNTNKNLENYYVIVENAPAEKKRSLCQEIQPVLKPVYNLSDDIIIPVTKAIPQRSWLTTLSSVLIGGAFLLISVLELMEINENLNEIEAELHLLRQRNDHEKKAEREKLAEEVALLYCKQKTAHLQLVLITGCLTCGSILVLAAATSMTAPLAFLGLSFFPLAMMAAIMLKYCLDYSNLQSELRAQQVILNDNSGKYSLAEKEKAQIKKENVADEIFYKKFEILAQVFILTSFIIGVSAASLGTAAFIVMLIGTTIAIMNKLHEMRTSPRHAERRDSLMRIIDRLRGAEKEEKIYVYSRRADTSICDAENNERAAPPQFENGSKSPLYTLFNPENKTNTTSVNNPVRSIKNI